MSHDLNSDPEVWELTDKFGDRALRIWIEMLSIGDRNDGLLKGTFSGWAESFMRIYSFGKSNPRWHKRDLETVQRAIRWMSEKGWIAFRNRSDGFLNDVREGSETALVIVNYREYHRTREPKQVPSEPSDPSLLIKNHKNDSLAARKTRPIKTSYPENFEVSDELRAWASVRKFRSPDLLLEAFRDHHVSKGNKFVDWVSAFRNWVRRDTEIFGARSNTGSLRQGLDAFGLQPEGELSERSKRILRRGL